MIEHLDTRGGSGQNQLTREELIDVGRRRIAAGMVVSERDCVSVGLQGGAYDLARENGGLEVPREWVTMRSSLIAGENKPTSKASFFSWPKRERQRSDMLCDRSPADGAASWVSRHTAGSPM
jgi:hypothetical protein